MPLLNSPFLMVNVGKIVAIVCWSQDLHVCQVTNFSVVYSVFILVYNILP